MYHLIGHDDHWAFHDPSANMFNFYRYSDWYYSLLFESMEYHNRMVIAEWREHGWRPTQQLLLDGGRVYVKTADNLIAYPLAAHDDRPA